MLIQVDLFGGFSSKCWLQKIVGRNRIISIRRICELLITLRKWAKMLADIILHFTETTYMSLRKQWELISPLATNEVWGDVLTLAFTAVKSKYLRRFNRSSKTDILRNEPLGSLFYVAVPTETSHWMTTEVSELPFFVLLCFLPCVNTLRPNSDQHQTSLCDIKAWI